jgi:hypothetical protein
MNKDNSLLLTPNAQAKAGLEKKKKEINVLPLSFFLFLLCFRKRTSPSHSLDLGISCTAGHKD